MSEPVGRRERDAGVSARPTARPAARRRVLVVDADESALAFAATALNSFRPGFDVATARSAAHAREWLDAFPPDVLVLGRAPDADALDGDLGRLLEDERLGRAKVLLLCDVPGATPLRFRAHSVLPKSAGLRALLDTIRGLA